ncbi:hypothetical protein [Jeotgalibacillus aurantiacus]|uniref:hypothetical protein n=1 Tax=Jeotgalibacillus aurantiacus TaxID=2763266 RepID=UPI001D09D8CC|nr:hypothetical protein [Jeotgalibacillus aurantiacus]
MRKVLLIISGTIIALLLVSVIYLKFNPPLSANGVSFYADDETKRVIEIINDGFTDVSLRQVMADEKKVEQTELGIGRSNHIIAGDGLDEDPYISFHNINEYAIQPALSSEELNDLYTVEDTQVVKHYGLRTFGDHSPQKITIDYTYLFLPSTLEVDVSE